MTEKGLQHSVYQIDGLDCADCAAQLEQQIASLTGVVKVTLNFGAAKLTVEHEGATAAIVQAVESHGYHLTAPGTAVPARSRWRHDRRAQLTAVSAVSLLAAVAADWLNASPAIWYALSMIAGGWFTARAGFAALRRGQFDANLLMVVAVIGAVAIGEWSEGAMVVCLFAIGNLLQSYTVDRTRRSIRAMMDLTPPEATVRRHDGDVVLPVAAVEIDDIVVVRPGERLPVDGLVIEGESVLNQAPITGESLPVEKRAGDTVYAGSVNGYGLLVLAVTRKAADSTLARIIHLVEEAQAQKAPVQQFIDRFAGSYTPLVMLGAVLFAVLPPLLFNAPFEPWLYKALTLLVISCPCALALSTPVSIVSAIGAASRRGVLIKGGAYLEEMSRIRAVAFDKTGTLTTGNLTVTDIVAAAGTDERKLLLAAAAIEQGSEHPIARAILAAAPAALPPAALFAVIPGQGAQAVISGQTLYAGNYRLFAAAANFSEMAVIGERLAANGKTIVYIGTQAAVLGLIAVADTMRSGSKAAIDAIRQAGVTHIAMLTGDNAGAAASVAKSLGLNQALSGLLPEEKVAAVGQLVGQYQHVAMVGDGINDAPALSAASIGISMGAAGSDAALEAADMALMADDLDGIAYAIRLGKRTLHIIRQNVWFAVGIKLVFVLLTLFGLSNLWMAVFADTGAAILVTLNSMRLMRDERTGNDGSTETGEAASCRQAA